MRSAEDGRAETTGGNKSERGRRTTICENKLRRLIPLDKVAVPVHVDLAGLEHSSVVHAARPAGFESEDLEVAVGDALKVELCMLEWSASKRRSERST